MFDYAVMIGKFSPIHDGHLADINHALTQARKIIVVLGQCFEARNTRMPFTEDERAYMIRLAVDHNPNVIVVESENFLYNDAAWIASIQEAVEGAIIHEGDDPATVSISLAGMKKDETSYYLNIFPQWKHDIACSPYVVEYKNHEMILSSTFIRDKIFEGELEYLRPYMHENVVKYLHGNLTNAFWVDLNSDWKYEKNYSSRWGHGPFVTVDACVMQAGHVILVERGGEYGGGLLAMPGGFLNLNEKITDGVIRELREETELKVPSKVLRGCITEKKVYDDPHRDNRSRIITHAHKIELNNDPNGLPKIKGADDAAKATWYPISFIKDNKDKFFGDHWHMLHDLIGF